MSYSMLIIRQSFSHRALSTVNSRLSSSFSHSIQLELRQQWLNRNQAQDISNLLPTKTAEEVEEIRAARGEIWGAQNGGNVSKFFLITLPPIFED